MMLVVVCLIVFKVYTSVVFIIFTELSNCHHNHSRIFSLSQGKTSCPLAVTDYIPPNSFTPGPRQPWIHLDISYMESYDI